MTSRRNRAVQRRRYQQPRRASSKQQARTQLLNELAERVYRRDGYTCQAVARVPDVDCHAKLDRPHHVLPRARGGADTMENLLTLCRAHHRWVHVNPAEAVQLGLLDQSWTQPRPQGGG